MQESTSVSSQPHLTRPNGLDRLRAIYRHERERRIRPDGPKQYRHATGAFGYYAHDPYTARTEREHLTDRVEVLVIGGGFGGLLTSARLQQAGVTSVRIMEEAGDFGGTWYWNRYPGIHCDIESYLYMPLLEEVGTMPTWRYAPGEEIRKHAVAIAEKFDLYRDVLFHTRATRLEWNEEAVEWVVDTDRGDRMRARYVITSSGTLSTPKLPGIPGLDTFRGHTFHTSRWDYSYTGGDQNGGLSGLADKKVAIVGTGATGVQVIPHVGRDAAHLYVFQRTPSTIDVRDNKPTDPTWAAGLPSGWQQERQDNFLSVLSGEPDVPDFVADGWTSTARLQRKMLTGSVDTTIAEDDRDVLDEILDAQKMDEIRARVDDLVTDPDVAAILKPWYRYMCKRPCFSDNYLQTFNRPNVTLVDTADHGGISQVTETSVIVGDTEYEVDCIIFATGFEVGVSGVVSGALPVVGRGGQSLLEAWAQGPQTLHGFYTHGFPNLFQLGAIHNANAVNFAHILQQQAEHIAAIIAAGRDAEARIIEPTLESQEEWGRTIVDTALDTFKFQSECTPGYYNREGAPPSHPVSYGPGPVAFNRLLTEWRRTRMSDVLRK